MYRKFCQLMKISHEYVPHALSVFSVCSLYESVEWQCETWRARRFILCSSVREDLGREIKGESYNFWKKRNCASKLCCYGNIKIKEQNSWFLLLFLAVKIILIIFYLSVSQSLLTIKLDCLFSKDSCQYKILYKINKKSHNANETFASPYWRLEVGNSPISRYYNSAWNNYITSTLGNKL